MTKFDWTGVIRTTIFFLKVIGIWSPSQTTCRCNLYTLYKVFTVVAFLLTNVVSQIINMHFIVGDVEAMALSFIFLLMFTSLTIKLMFFIKDQHILEDVLAVLDAEPLFQPTTQQESHCRSVLNNWKKLYMAFSVSMYAAIASWVLFPVIDNSYGEHPLIYLAWYPFDAEVSPLYQIVYCYQTICFFIGGVALANIDMFIIVLMEYIGLQCDILCDNLRNLDLSKNNEDNRSEISRQFVNCIVHYQKIFSFSQKCKSFFKMIIFGQFLSCSINLAILMFQLTLVEPLSTFFYTLVFSLVVILVQIFQYCWFATRLESKSSNIPYAAFEMNFVGAPISAQKSLIIFVARTQKSIQIPVLGVFPLSLETYVKILRASGSCLTVLRRMNIADE